MYKTLTKCSVHVVQLTSIYAVSSKDSKFLASELDFRLSLLLRYIKATS